MITNAPNRSVRQAAFSLVELMIAVGLLAIIMVALLMTFQQVQRAMHVGINQVDVLENGRSIMTLISRDLQELTYSEDTNAVNLFVTNRTEATTWVPKFPTALQDLYVLIQTNNHWVSVKYSFYDDDVTRGYPMAVLYRRVNPTNGIATPNVWDVATTNVIDKTGLDPLSNGYHRVADGIVHFKIQALKANGELYDPTNSTPTMTIVDEPGGFQSCRFTSTNLPAFIDIEFGIVEPKTLKEFNALSEDRDRATAYLTNRPGKIHLFRQRIPVRSQYRTEL